MPSSSLPHLSWPQDACRRRVQAQPMTTGLECDGEQSSTLRSSSDEDLGRRRAAAYLAKYSTKSTEDQGVLDHRLRAGVPESLELPGHLRNLVETAWQLGGEPERRELRLRAWAHTAGYRGHFLTKSRRFSTTFAELRDDS